jgi:hypothetical protein
MLHGAAHWKATIHIYRYKKFLKFKKWNALMVACPKPQKAILAALEL